MRDRFLAAASLFAMQVAIFEVFLFAIRVFEVWSVAGRVENYSLGSEVLFIDLVYGLKVSAAFFLPTVLIMFADLATGKLINSICFVSVLVLHFLVTSYFIETLVPLSADFFGYTLSDIFYTVTSSSEVSAVTISAGVCVVLLALLCFYFVSRINASHTVRNVMTSVLILFLVAGWIFGGRVSGGASHLADNKSSYFISQSFAHFVEGDASISFRPDQYPFLHRVHYNGALSKYFNLGPTPPDIVFIIVEGLGRDFTGEGAQFGGFTPFLDSLSENSLYWKNALSNAGRTFGALPSVLGSLPYGKEGFMSYGTKMPSHNTLVSLLKPYGYHARFFYGGNPNFDNQDVFLERQGFDCIVDETKFPATYKRMNADRDGFSWGFADRDVFGYSRRIANNISSPLIDVYLTLSTHEPFRVPEAVFLERTKSIIEKMDSRRKSLYRPYQNVFSSLLYTDDAIREYFNSVKNDVRYKNTIFIITGDHRLVPVPQATRLARFHVPMMIFSPMLKSAAEIKSLTTHSAILPALLGLLKRQYGFDFSDEMAFISDSVSTDRRFSSSLDIALIRNKNEINDYVEGKYFYSENQLFLIDERMDLQPIEDSKIKDRLSRKLDRFKAASAFALENNRLTKDTAVFLPQFILARKDESFIAASGYDTMLTDQVFEKARTLAYKKAYDESELLLKYILNKSPNFHDARVLLGRISAWNGDLDSARIYFSETIGRSPYNKDAYIASIDLMSWSHDLEESRRLISVSRSLFPDDPDVAARIARDLIVEGKKEEGQRMLKDILNKVPDHEFSKNLLETL